MKKIVISLGGSLIVPKEIDISFLRKFKQLIEEYVAEDNQVVIIAGGGHTSQVYLDASKEIIDTKKEDLDWIGIKATKLNGELLRSIFPDVAYEKVVDDPTAPILTDKKVIIGSGWKPGASSDLDAVLIAANLKVGTVVNMTNVDRVYDKDPNEFPDAKPFDEISWKEYIGFISKKWTPRLNLPFDPVASREAEKKGIKAIIIDGKDLANLKRVLYEKSFEGTTISDN